MAVDGRWSISYPTMMGQQEATLELTARGGALAGKWSGATGGADIAGGTVEGDAVAWTVTVATPHGDIALIFEGTVDGDVMTGTLQTPAGQNPFSGARA